MDKMSLQWTKDRPTESGWYWLRGARYKGDMKEVYIARLKVQPGGWIWESECDSYSSEDAWTWWRYGPLTSPPLPKGAEGE